MKIGKAKKQGLYILANLTTNLKGGYQYVVTNNYLDYVIHCHHH